MQVIWLVLASLVVFANFAQSRRLHNQEPARRVERLVESAQLTADDVKARAIQLLARQLQMGELRYEETVRSNGGSGLKQIRDYSSGTRNYHSNSHRSRSAVAAIHDHGNNIRTVGLGEFSAVLNGIEFRTRHNDYRLYMPHSTSSDYHAYEDIPFSEIPPEVASKPNVSEEIKEMREWFAAWKNQDYSVRDYRKYFKPIICYLEGAWTHTTENIDEPFFSDRHFIDATSWFELLEKIKFTTDNGRKSALENFAFLPTRLLDISNQSLPIIAQWNYRIMCMPLKDDLPLNRFRYVDELKSRVPNSKSVEETKTTRSALFRLDPYDTGDATKERFKQYGLLDKLMYQVPGKDNQKANLIDEAFDELAYSLESETSNINLNAGFYHRWYKVLKAGAMGRQVRKRGFADDNMFVALNTQNQVTQTSAKHCTGSGADQTCKTMTQRVSYAIPLEIVYMTPLQSWNPFNLAMKGLPSETEGKTVSADGRNGGDTPEKAYNGTNDKFHFITPDAFFSGAEVATDAADTAPSAVNVLDQSGVVRKVRASGIRTLLPEIAGVGIMRQRYPIMPIYGRDSPAWKELEALKDIVLEPTRYAGMLRETSEARKKRGIQRNDPGSEEV